MKEEPKSKRCRWFGCSYVRGEPSPSSIQWTCKRCGHTQMFVSFDCSAPAEPPRPEKECVCDPEGPKCAYHFMYPAPPHKEEGLDEFVRDVCSVAPKSKSEVRRRLLDFKAQWEAKAREEGHINGWQEGYDDRKERWNISTAEDVIKEARAAAIREERERVNAVMRDIKASLGTHGYNSYNIIIRAIEDALEPKQQEQ